MDPLAIMRTLIALCIALEIRPKELAEIYADDKAIQEYYDRFLQEAASAKEA